MMAIYCSMLAVRQNYQFCSDAVTNCSTPSSNNSQLTPAPPGCSTGDSGFLTTRPDSTGGPTRFPFSAWPTIFNIQADVYLVQHDSQIVRLRVRDHNEFERSRRLIVVQLIMACPVGNEAPRRDQFQPLNRPLAP